MNTLPMLDDALRHQRQVAQELLQLVEMETAALASGGSLPAETAAAKQRLLPRLTSAVQRLKQQREQWQSLSPEVRAGMSGTLEELRSTQELLMKVILRDRENEQKLLRLGAVPARQMSKVTPQATPHFVAHLYQRSQGSR